MRFNALNLRRIRLKVTVKHSVVAQVSSPRAARQFTPCQLEIGDTADLEICATEKTVTLRVVRGNFPA